MKENILQIINKLNYCDTQIVPLADNQSLLLLFSSYAPASKPSPSGIISLSNYYATSQQAYLKTQKIIGQLQALRIPADFYRAHDIKQRALQTGGGIGYNSLYYHPQLGSTIHIQAVQIEATLTPTPSTAVQSFCGDCTLCEQACPTNAIIDGVFHRSKCMRNYINQSPIPTQFGRHIYQLIGCERCQTACPQNFFRETANKHRFDLIEVLQGEHTRTIQELIGSNYGRWARLMNQSLFYAANTHYTAAHSQAIHLLKHEHTHAAATYALQVLKKD